MILVIVCSIREIKGDQEVQVQMEDQDVLYVVKFLCNS